MFKSILVSTDFSPASWKALQIGLQLKEAYAASLHFLHVFPTIEQQEYPEHVLKKVEALKTKMKKMSDDISNKEDINSVVIPGNVKKQLLKFVEKHKFDLVIVGVNGNGQDNTPGSNVCTILENCKSPVLVVPNNFVFDE